MLPLRLIFSGFLLSTTLHAGLLAHWKLDSSTADEVANFPATWSTTENYYPFVEAPYSSAAAFLSGASAGRWLKAGTGMNFERNQPFSATTWIRAFQQNSTVIGDMMEDEDRRGWEIHIGNTANGGASNSVTVWLVSDYPSVALQVNATANVEDYEWHHVAFTYDGSSTAAGLKIYIDGKPAATTVGINTLAGSIANNTGAEFNIGCRMNGASSVFQGSIDEVALFDHVLSAAAMNSVFLSGVESLDSPHVTTTAPLPGQAVTAVTSADVTFSLPVTGVDAWDLLVNGIPASSVQVIDAKTRRFTYSPPPLGNVNFTWAAGHRITGQFGAPAQPVGWTANVVSVLPPPQIIISEFLCNNAGRLEDEDHDTPDWIELTNVGTATANLAGWALTDDPANPRAWVLPSTELLPGASKIVFASGKNRSISGGTLHANFKLADDGGYLALSNPSGGIAHAYDGYPRQEGNVSFGLHATGKPADGRAAWRYMTATPNAAPSTILSAGAISYIGSSPAAPVAGDPITVTIRTSPEAAVSPPPKLFYKVMYDPESSIDFADDGLHGDGVAGDLVWGATIPAGAAAGKMVRWRAALTSGPAESRWPVSNLPNELLPLYEGTVIGGNTAGQVLPVYQVFVQNYQIPTSTAQSGIDSTLGGRGAFYGNGKLYDNVFIRTKGTTSLNLLKRSHRVDFNPGREFEWSTTHEPQRELNLNSEYVDPSYLRQNQQLWMHRDSGNAGAPHFPVRLLMNGVSWQLAFHTYPADSELIKVLGLDPRGALYKQVGTLTGGQGEQKSRRWEQSKADLSALASGLATNAAARSLFVHDNLNLPAVINYLAVTRIAQEADDVWANMVVYRDTENTKEWRPIPFDLNLSFGQLFYGFSAPYNTTVQATTDTNKSHPLYGSAACQTYVGNNGYNRLYDAIIQEPVTRTMLLRRIRTLTDRYLTTTAAASPLEKNFDTLGALIKADADIDRGRWGLPPNSGVYGLGPNISPAQGLATLKSDFLAPRRTHFHTTHSINNTAKTLGIGNGNKAGIPDAQIASPVISFGTIEAHPANGNQDEEYIQLNNPAAAGGAAIDISGWTLRGGAGSFEMKGGTVIPAAGSLYVSPDVAAFRARATSPKANENRYVVGPYSGHLSPYGETLRLENASGQLVAQIQVPAYLNPPPVTLAVTEIMSSSSHTSNKINGDWWELTNTGGLPLDLSGLSWSDNSNPSVKIIFPSLSLAAGESIIILNEDDDDEAGFFRAAWGLPNTVRILTREDFGLGDLPGLGANDSIIIYKPTNAIAARADYTSHSAGKSRAWFRNGVAILGGYSQLSKYGAVKSTQSPPDVASPGFSMADPATLTNGYDIWAASNELWTAAETLSTADPDNDGRTNRAEYLFGGHPRLTDGPPPQTILPKSGGFEWTFTRRTNDSSVAVILQSSADLIHWTTITPALVKETAHPTLTGHKTATYLVPGDSGVKFLRARAD